MATGLRIRGAGTQRVQIDQQYRNMALLSKGYVTCNSLYNGAGYGTFYGIFTIYGIVDPVIAVNGTYTFAIVRSVPISGGIQYTIISQTQGAGFQYYAFGSNQNDPKGVGLRVRTDSGLTAYNSLNNYMKVLDFFGGSNAPAESVYRNYPGKTIAVVQGAFSNETQVSIFSEYEAYILYAYNYASCPNGSTISVAWGGGGGEGPYDPNTLQVRDIYQYSYQYLVLDVTGL